MLFKKLSGDNGEETYQEMSEEDIASFITGLDEKFIKQHAEYSRVNNLYTKAVEESKTRLARAQKAETELNSKAETPKGLDVDSVYEEIAKRLQAEREQKTTQENDIRKLIEDHNLSNIPNVMDMLTNAANPATQAELLSKAGFRFDDTEGGEASPTSGLGSILANVDKNLGLS